LNPNNRKINLDFGLVLATVVVLGVISLICVGGMFYYRGAHIDQASTAVKEAWLLAMNRAVTPPLICLILLLAMCIPKRLLPRPWLWRLGGALGLISAIAFFAAGFRAALLVVLTVSVLLQTTVTMMAAAGSRHLSFARPGYWQRLGSSLIHLGLVLFVADLLLYRHHTLHLFLFWGLTAAIFIGLVFSFYPRFCSRLIGRGADI